MKMKSLMRANQVGLMLQCTGRYKIWILMDHINYLIKFLKMKINYVFWY